MPLTTTQNTIDPITILMNFRKPVAERPERLAEMQPHRANDDADDQRDHHPAKQRIQESRHECLL